MKHLSIIQHTQSEWLGAIEDHLEGRGIRFGYYRPFASGGSLPNVMTAGDGLVLLGGGPWGAATPGKLLPSLDAEVRLVRAGKADSEVALVPAELPGGLPADIASS